MSTHLDTGRKTGGASIELVLPTASDGQSHLGRPCSRSPVSSFNLSTILHSNHHGTYWFFIMFDTRFQWDLLSAIARWRGSVQLTCPPPSGGGGGAVIHKDSCNTPIRHSLQENDLVLCLDSGLHTCQVCLLLAADTL